MAAGVERAGADTIEAATRSADVVAGVGRYQLGQLTRPNVVALPSNLECTLNPSKKKKTDPFFTSSLLQIVAKVSRCIDIDEKKPRKKNWTNRSQILKNRPINTIARLDKLLLLIYWSENVNLAATGTG